MRFRLYCMPTEIDMVSIDRVGIREEVREKELPSRQTFKWIIAGYFACKFVLFKNPEHVRTFYYL